jgi:hypothetical protein
MAAAEIHRSVNLTQEDSGGVGVLPCPRGRGSAIGNAKFTVRNRGGSDPPDTRRLMIGRTDAAGR